MGKGKCCLPGLHDRKCLRSSIPPAWDVLDGVQAVQLFKSYFGGAFDEDAIRNNFVLIYELLDGGSLRFERRGCPAAVWHGEPAWVSCRPSMTIWQLTVICFTPVLMGVAPCGYRDHGFWVPTESVTRDCEALHHSRRSAHPIL